jgi:hypothetical protein
MTRARESLVLAVLVLAATGARLAPHAPSTEPPITRLAPATVLARYAAALGKLRRPPSISFEYSVAQLGLRNMEQTHRVYRSGLNERDETLVVDSYTLRQPEIRILANRTYRYDIAAVAPKPADYSFAFEGTRRDASGYTYTFRAQPHNETDFAVTAVEIDGHSFLPSMIRFKISGDGAHGSGRLEYGPAEQYWVVRLAAVSVHLASGATAHERIEWTAYRFPPSLPASTFEVPRALPTTTPLIPEGSP